MFLGKQALQVVGGETPPAATWSMDCKRRVGVFSIIHSLLSWPFRPQFCAFLVKLMYRCLRNWQGSGEHSFAQHLRVLGLRLCPKLKICLSFAGISGRSAPSHFSCQHPGERASEGTWSLVGASLSVWQAFPHGAGSSHVWAQAKSGVRLVQSHLLTEKEGLCVPGIFTRLHFSFQTSF